eukprot:COSAG06_NODE_1238_length_10133_cov_3382.190452_3_plen_97_part_00
MTTFSRCVHQLGWMAMDLPLFVLLLLAAAGVGRCAAPGTYTNPILAGNWPDPGAIQINGSFLIATTGDGFALHRSDDLGAPPRCSAWLPGRPSPAA